MIYKEFFIVPEELFRIGNANNPRLSNVRPPRDIDTVKINGVVMVIANEKGMSVFNKEGIQESPMTGWVWMFSTDTELPFGLKLIQDKPDHYCIAPAFNMPLDDYKGLLEQLALKATRVLNKEGRSA